jgi:hypothetical protein
VIVKPDASLIAALLKLLASLNKPLFVGPVAVDAAGSKSEIPLGISADAVLIAASAKLVPVEIILLSSDTLAEIHLPIVIAVEDRPPISEATLGVPSLIMEVVETNALLSWA